MNNEPRRRVSVASRDGAERERVKRHGEKETGVDWRAGAPLGSSPQANAGGRRSGGGGGTLVFTKGFKADVSQCVCVFQGRRIKVLHRHCTLTKKHCWHCAGRTTKDGNNNYTRRRTRQPPIPPTPVPALVNCGLLASKKSFRIKIQRGVKLFSPTALCLFLPPSRRQGATTREAAVGSAGHCERGAERDVSRGGRQRPHRERCAGLLKTEPCVPAGQRRTYGAG